MVTIVEEPVIIELKEPEEQEPATEEVPPAPQELLEPATPRKPGRPAGAKSKIPGKPRAPRTKKAAEVVEKDIDKDIALEPTRHLPDSRSIPTMSHEPGTNVNTNVNTNASRMLNLLAEHSRSRQNRKADLWKSWFR